MAEPMCCHPARVGEGAEPEPKSRIGFRAESRTGLKPGEQDQDRGGRGRCLGPGPLGEPETGVGSGLGPKSAELGTGWTEVQHPELGRGQGRAGWRRGWGLGRDSGGAGSLRPGQGRSLGRAGRERFPESLRREGDQWEEERQDSVASARLSSTGRTHASRLCFAPSTQACAPRASGSPEPAPPPGTSRESAAQDGCPRSHAAAAAAAAANAR